MGTPQNLLAVASITLHCSDSIGTLSLLPAISFVLARRSLGLVYVWPQIISKIDPDHLVHVHVDVGRERLEHDTVI